MERGLVFVRFDKKKALKIRDNRTRPRSPAVVTEFYKHIIIDSIFNAIFWYFDSILYVFNGRKT